VYANKGEDLIVSTITSSTVAILSTPALGGSLPFIGIIFLVILLVQKELAYASTDQRLHRLSKALNISLVPLLCAFILVLIVKVGEVLR